MSAFGEGRPLGACRGSVLLEFGKGSKWELFRLLAVFVAFEWEPFLGLPSMGQDLKSQMPRDYVIHVVLSGQRGLQTLDILASTCLPSGKGRASGGPSGLAGAPFFWNLGKAQNRICFVCWQFLWLLNVSLSLEILSYGRVRSPNCQKITLSMTY